MGDFFIAGQTQSKDKREECIMKRIMCYLMGFLCALSLAACGGSSSSSSTGEVSSLEQVPDVTDMVGGASASASLSALQAAVSGTPPLLTSITESNADTYFWNGLIAAINGGTTYDLTNPAVWDTVSNNLFNGEGSCRMAQAVGFSFQGISQAGTSLCYMKGIPTAMGEEGLVSGPEGTTIDNLFQQGSANKIIQVEVTGGGDAETPENVFIRVYGTGTDEGSAGYAIDLWFCATGGSTPNGYEQIRVNNSAGTMTQDMVHTDWGNFTAQFSGYTATDSSGNVSFDKTKTQSVTLGESGAEWGDHKEYVSVTGDQIETKSWQSGSWGERKVYITSQYSGTSTDTLRFLTAGFNGIEQLTNDTFTFNGGSEFQDTVYAATAAGNSYFDTAASHDVSGDSFFSGTIGANTTLLSALSSFSCSDTPDIVVSMDFTNTAVQAVEAACENDFQDMNFCDGTTIQQARETVWMSN